MNFAIFGQLGSKLEAQDPPKSRPKPEKIDVEKQHVFGIDFGRVRTSFRKGFRYVFLNIFSMSVLRQVHIADMLVIQQDHSFC